MTGRGLRTGLTLGALAAIAIVAAALTFGGDDGYTLYAKFKQAGGLRQGFKVRIDGAPVGKIESLTLDKQDRVVAKLLIDKSAAPVGTDVRATARAADLLGEKFIDISPGNRSHPAPSGTVIPPARTGLAVELDDVINSIDLPTRSALRAFLNENGQWFVGRGNDLGATLAALPGALDRSGELLHQFAADTHALGALVDDSDRVVASIAREHRSLGHFVSAASGTFDALGKRNGELAASVREAPATLRSARTALRSLQRAAKPLGPAAKGLGTTAPQLTATLRQLPGFAHEVRPTLATIREVAPTLGKLGSDGTPLVRRLKPLTGDLNTFSSSFEPVSKTLDSGIADILGVLEGWARATQGNDAGSHIFRFGLTFSADTFSSLTALLNTKSADKGKKLKASKPASSGAASKPLEPLTSKLPKVTAPVQNAVNGLLQKLGVEKPSGSDDNAKPLLDFLLGK